VLFIVLAAIGIATAIHRYLATYAPSNILIARVRMARPRWGLVVRLTGVVGLLIVAMHLVVLAIAVGAPGWLNLIVLVLAWDTIKLACLDIGVAVRCVGAGISSARKVVV
jgi:hypothetical protein